MATHETISNAFALVFFKFPGRKPADKKEFDLAFGIWSKIYAPIPDDRLNLAVTRFVAETKKLFPDDCPFAMIREMAQPSLTETIGDCLELLDEAVSRFGMYRESEALAWLEGKSPLVTASVRRIGFINYCMSEEPDVIRGQIRAVFEAEKGRSKTVGGVLPSATHLEAGDPPMILDSRVSGLLENLTEKKTLRKSAA